MPSPLRPGLYDSLVDGRLRRALSQLGEEFLHDEAELDPADVPDRASRLFAEVLRAELASVAKPELRVSLLRELRNVLLRAEADLLRSGELELEPTPRRLLVIALAAAG